MPSRISEKAWFYSTPKNTKKIQQARKRKIISNSSEVIIRDGAGNIIETRSRKEIIEKYNIEQGKKPDTNTAHIRADWLRKNQTGAERKLQKKLIPAIKKLFNLNVISQHLLIDKQHKFFYILDFFVCGARLCIEVDGDIHNTERQQQHDNIRTGYLRSKGIDVVRFTNNEINTDILEVINKITGIVHNRLQVKSAKQSTDPRKQVRC